MPKLSLNTSKKTKRTPAGVISVDWACYEMGELATIHSGGTPSKDNARYWDGNVPWLSAKDLKSFRVKTSINKISPLGVVNGTRLVPAGSILVLVRGMMLLKCFPVAVAEVAVTFNQDLKAIIADERKVLGIYLAYFLDSQGEQIRSFTTLAGHGTGRLALEVLVNLPVPLPPLPEQRRISGILSTWDRSIETLESLIAAKERRKQTLMQQLLSGRMRLPGFAKEKWRKVQMSEILKRVFRPIEWHAEKQLSLVSLRRRNGGLFRRPDMLGSEYKTQDLHELKAEDFLISKRQVSHGAWGIVPPGFEGSHVSKEYAILVNRAPSKLHMPFFARLAQTSRMIHQARVASTGVHIEKLIFDPAVFLRESISLPPTIKEQQKIAAIFETIDRELTLHRQHLESLRLQKRGLMQKLLTGKVRT